MDIELAAEMRQCINRAWRGKFEEEVGVIVAIIAEFRERAWKGRKFWYE